MRNRMHNPVIKIVFVIGWASNKLSYNLMWKCTAIQFRILLCPPSPFSSTNKQASSPQEETEGKTLQYNMLMCCLCLIVEEH
jgi:hypothetical protein